MKRKIKHITIISLFIITTVLVIGIGFKNPPDKLKATDISVINSISINNNEKIKLTNEEIAYWKTLEFEIAEEDYPGETPDLEIILNTPKNSFMAMYNINDDIIFFSFVTEVKYGFLNSQSPGGWTKPLYKIKADKKLFKLLKINNVI